METLKLSKAAEVMTEQLGWPVSVHRIKKLCEQDKVIFVSDPTRQRVHIRIPEDALHILREQLERRHQGIRLDFAIAIINECRKTYLWRELEKETGYCKSMFSYIKSGDRPMSVGLYDKLREIAEEANDNE